MFGLVGEDEVEGLPPEEREGGGGVGGRVRRGHPAVARYVRNCGAGQRWAGAAHV